MKYRLVKRARGWALQEREELNAVPPLFSRWETLSTHRCHWFASLKLWFLRESERQ